MARAIHLARRGWYTARPNPRVGCVIVKNGEVIGQGFHRKAGESHAEVNALKDAGEQVRGATVYVTLEPCSHHGRTPPCTDILAEAGVSRVVIGMIDPNPAVSGSGIKSLHRSGIEVTRDILKTEAEKLNPGFIKRMSTGLPYIRIKMAMSLDGRTAMASGQSQWITGPQARAEVHRMRAASDAVLTGSGTVAKDNPSLTFRLSEHEFLRAEIPADVVQPLRVVCDSRASMSPRSAMLNLQGKTLVVTSEENDNSRALVRAGAEILRIDADTNGRLPLNVVMNELAKREINDVMIESGAGIAGGLLEAGLVDEIIIFMAPHIMGDNARGLFHLPALRDMSERKKLHVSDIRAIGADWKITIFPE